MLFWICLILVVGYLILEKIRLEKSRRTLTWRIHVYGTRGKTGLTLQVISALRQSGLKVLGRTTGDAPVLHLPDGGARPQRRWGAPNIHEYMACLNRAADLGCQALVMECMALSPENVHKAGEILRPDFTLLTNPRPDHYESQGPSDEDVVRTLALSLDQVPAALALADAGAPVLRARAEAGGCSLELLEGGDLNPGEQARLLTRRLSEKMALPEPAPEEPDRPAGWPSFQCLSLENFASFYFLDLYSANDVLSSRLTLKKALEGLPAGQSRGLPLVALLSSRADRPLRSQAFINWFAAEKPFDLYALAGDHSWYACLAMRRRGLEPLVTAIGPGRARPEVLLRRIRQALPATDDGPEIHPGLPAPGSNPESAPLFALVGLGNAHGYGRLWREFMTKRLKEKTVCF